MGRVNPWGLKRPAIRQESRTFNDPEQPDVALELTFHRLSIPELTRSLAQGQAYAEEWADQEIPAPDGGEAIVLDAGTCMMFARFEAMLVGEPISFLDWIGYATTMPNATVMVMTWAEKFTPGATDEGNSPRASSPISSPSPPSSDTTDSTPR